MMAPEYYTFTGREGEVMIPDHVTHVLIEKVKFVRARAFMHHPNIEEVICHDGVEKIEQLAFYLCPSLRRVIMPGVKVIEERAFDRCKALNYTECGKLEIIRERAFTRCESLSGVDLPSIKIVERYAFHACYNLTNAKFGMELESIRDMAFSFTSLKRITLPLKDGMIDNAWVFNGLKHVDLVGGVHETVAALLLEEWKNDMNEEINSINEVLSDTPSDDFIFAGWEDQAIDTWIRSVLRKITHYEVEHRLYLNVTTALEPALSNDIVLNNVLPFLSKSFERG